jgi:hypothetical protein
MKYEKTISYNKNMSIQFSTEVTVLEFNSEGYTVKFSKTALISHTGSSVKQETQSIERKLTDLDIMRKFIMQLANKSPTLFLEESEIEECDQFIDDANDDESWEYCSDASEETEEEVPKNRIHTGLSSQEMLNMISG